MRCVSIAELFLPPTEVVALRATRGRVGGYLAALFVFPVGETLELGEVLRGYRGVLEALQLLGVEV